MSYCISCGKSVDSNGTCTACKARHDYCYNCTLFVTKASNNKQFCPICGKKVEVLKKSDMETLFLDNYGDIVAQVKEFIDGSNLPVYEYQIYDLLKDKLVDGYRFSKASNSLTLPNMLKYVFRKNRGYSKVPTIFVVFQDKNNIKPDIETNTPKAICRTEVFENLDMEEYYNISEVIDEIPDDYVRMSFEDSKRKLQEYYDEREEQVQEFLAKYYSEQNK